jgi:tape measure domain-containing protein
MAESVARVKILAQIEGLEGFEKLKGAFRGLQAAIGPADSDLAKARKEILAFGQAGAQTERVIQGQVEALKALKSQAAVGSTTYRQLSKDIESLGQSYQLATTGAMKFTEAQLRNQSASRSPSLASQQIQVLKKDLAELDVLSDQYVRQLSQIANRENILNARTGRAGVLAAARAFDQDAFPDPFRNLQQLPNTTAALEQQVSELTTKLSNLDRSSSEYTNTAIELANAQRQLRENLLGVGDSYTRLEQAEERAIRRAEKLAAIQRDSLKAPNVGGFRDPETGAIIARGSRDRSGYRFDQNFGPNYGPQEPSALFRQVMAAGMAPVANQNQLMGKSYAQVAENIRLVGRASDGSINSLQAQRSAWEALRGTIATTDPAFKQATRNIQQLDQQLERLQPTGGFAGKIGYIGQGIGAAASAGIFGGPEGALGGLGGGAIGALLGGPAGFAAGAFIGSSAGAYAGMGRQQLGGFADYAAQLEKQQIALRGVAGSLEEYQRAVAAARSASDQFNVPIGESTKSMTQLSAAVIGAGGRIADAEVVYKNITAAIKATGGGAEEVQGSLTAMAQIFSKGKVSAEELQGQLGERLPGAVTAFARATGRTLPQLQKDLEQGVVGLNDVMRFVVSLGDQYTATANKVAQSDADAGQRFQRVFADFRAAIGKELIPLGAELQGAFADFLQDITPGLVSAVRGFTSMAQAIGGLITAWMDFTAPVRNFFATEIPAYFATAVAFWRKIDNDLEAFRNRIASFVQSVGKWFTDLFNGIASTAKGALQAIGVDADWLAGAFRNVIKFLGDAWNGFFDFVAKRWQETVRNMVNYSNPLFAALKVAGIADVGGAVVEGMAAGNASRQATQAPPAPVLPPPSVTGLSTFEDPTGKDVKDKAEKAVKDQTDAANREAERLAAEEQRRQEALAKAKIALDEAVFRNGMELLRKRYEFEEERIRSQQSLWAKTFTGIRRESAQAAVDLEERLRGIEARVRDAALQVSASEQGLRSARATEAASAMGLTAQPVGAGLSAPNIARGSVGGGRLSVGTIKALAKAAGFSERDASIMAAIAMAESSGNSSALNNNPKTGDLSYGLWQVNMIGRMGPERRRQFGIGNNDALYDPATNAMAARRVFESQGFGAWSVFRSGAYRQYLPGAMQAAAGSVPGRMPTGVASQINRNIAADGGVDVAKAELATAKQNLALTKEQAEILKEDTIQGYIQDRLTGLRSEAEQLDMSNQMLLERQKLEAAGTRPEFVEAGLRVKELEIQREKELAQIRANMVKFPERQAIYNEELQRTADLYDVLIDGEYQMAEAKTAQGVALAAYIGQLKLQLQELTNLESLTIRIGQTLETEISTAMSSAVTAVVTGSGTVKEALGSMFKSIGQSFVKMATDIIAKQMVMIVLQSVLKALGGGMFGGGGATGGGFPVTGLNFLGGGSALPTNFAANGATFANGTARFAKGGIVNRPTFFKFANGGTMQNGVMGEAGPEAIVPLKRGFDGKLGIAQVRAPQGGDTRMRDMMGRSPAQQQAPTLNLKFETTKINGVEYVSKDQLEIAMAQTRRQAANDGAKRGMNMTLDKIQNSPSTRSRVGIR